jgi:MFS family permease
MNSKARLSLVIFIVITTIINSVQQMIPPNLLSISNYFGFEGDTAPLGVLTFTFTIISGIAMVIFGYLADKLVRKWLVLGGVFVYSFFAALIFLVPGTPNGFRLFYILITLSGAGFGAAVPSVFSLIADIIRQEDRSKGFSFFSIANLMGMMVGIVLSTFLGQLNWKLPYLIIGIVGLVSAGLMVKFQEPPRLGGAIDVENPPEISYRIKKEDLPIIFSKKSNIWLILNFVDTIPTGIILFLIYTFMKTEHNMPESLTLVFLAFILISTLIGTIVFGYVGDNLFKLGYKKARVQLALIANIVPIPFVFIALLIPFRMSDEATIADIFRNSGALLMLVLMVIGLFINGAVNGSWYATVVDLNLPEHRGTVLATANFFDILGKSLGPLIASFITDTYGILAGMTSSIFAWILLPFFWISLWRNCEKDMANVDSTILNRISKQ